MTKYHTRGRAKRLKRHKNSRRSDKGTRSPQTGKIRTEPRQLKSRKRDKKMAQKNPEERRAVVGEQRESTIFFYSKESKKMGHKGEIRRHEKKPKSKI